MRHEYFYNDGAEKYAFISIPKKMISDPSYKTLSTDAKLLYALMLDRASLSRKNKWIDGHNRVFIYYTAVKIMEDLNCANAKATKLMKELESMDLIERKRQGLGKPTIIYVKDFAHEQAYEDGASMRKVVNAPEEQEENHENHDSGHSKIEYLDTWKAKANKNNDIHTETESIHSDPDKKDDPINREIQSNPDGYCKKLHDRQWYRSYFEQRLCLDALRNDYPTEAKRAEELIDLLADTCASERDYIYLSGEKRPSEGVRDTFLNLKREHLLYVLDRLEKNTTEVRNMKQYLLATLYNAPMTMNNYYCAAVNYARTATE